MKFLKRRLYIDYDRELAKLWLGYILLSIAVIILGLITLINGLSTRTAEASPEPQNWRITSEMEVTEELSIEDYIRSEAQKAGVDPDVAVAIAKCESSLNPNAKHLISSAKGLYQFTAPTWKWIKADGDRLDYKASTREFLKWFPIYKGWWKDCLPKNI